eukprot:1817465-Alexandrium_andersonii.AAC.1
MHDSDHPIHLHTPPGTSSFPKKPGASRSSSVPSRPPPQLASSLARRRAYKPSLHARVSKSNGQGLHERLN